jgi:hypothetical protein
VLVLYFNVYFIHFIHSPTHYQHQAHYLTRAIFDVIIVYLLVELHSGIDAPWMIANVIPWRIWGGSREHFHHHVDGSCSFQKFFTYADRLFGTSYQGIHKGPRWAQVPVAHSSKDP